MSVAPTRFLATVMFTDIVGSTARAAAVGDRRWEALLATYQTTVARVVEDHDGWIANRGVALMTFDGPARAVRCAEARRALCLGRAP